MKREMRSLLSGVNLVVLIVTVAVGTWGVFVSMTDADGEHFIGNLATAAPSIYAGWCMLEPAVRRSPQLGGVMVRLMTACLIAPAFAALPIGIIQAIAVIFPGVRDSIASAAESNGGFHYFWSEGIAAQLLLVPLAGWVIGMCTGLGVALILSLPILSLRAPHVVAAGSHLEKVDGAQRDSTSAFVFCGLGALVLGIVLWQFGGGDSILEFPEDVARFLSLAFRGNVYWQDSMWLFGVVFVAVGIVVMGWGCVRVMSARARAARG